MSASHFDDPAVAARYAEGPPRMVPGLAAMHCLVEQILAESVPDGGRVLVVGAGGGLELAHLAGTHDRWTFDGVDPSAAMLDEARRVMGPLMSRATLHQGYVDDAPLGPFGAATCLLTLHFVERAERRATLEAIRRRLRPGGPLLTFHHSIPDGDTRAIWLRRFVRFASDGRVTDEEAEARLQQMAMLPTLSPEADAALLREAGFKNVETFFAALTFHGWVSYA